MKRSIREQELFEQKITQIIVRFNARTNRIIKEICEEVKQNCKTGAEALEMLSGLHAESQMKLQRVDALMYEEASKILQEEINNRLL